VNKGIIHDLAYICLSSQLIGTLGKTLAEARFLPRLEVTGRAHQGGDRIPQVMEMQLRSPVRWAACVQMLAELGCDTFIEVGPKRALTGMMRELAPSAAAAAVGTPDTVSQLTI